MASYLGFDFSTQQVCKSIVLCNFYSILKAIFLHWQVKILATNDSLQPIMEVNVHFDSELPHYKTKGWFDLYWQAMYHCNVLTLLWCFFAGGAHIQDDNLTVTAPTIMWVEALDLALEKLKNKGFDFHSVAAISGTGQVGCNKLFCFITQGFYCNESRKNLKCNSFI